MVGEGFPFKDRARCRQHPTSKLTHLAAVVGISACLAVGIIEAGQPTTTQTQPSEQFDLRGGYRAGQRLALTQTVQVLEYRVNEPDKIVGRRTVMMAMPITTSRRDTQGEVGVRLVVRRLVESTEINGQLKETDSDKPETFPGGQVDKGAPIVGAGFDAVLNNSGGVESIQLDKEFLKTSAYYGGAAANRPEMVKYLCSVYSHVLQSPWAYMPSKPVGIGDKWSFDRKTHALERVSSGSIEVPQEVVYCSLKAIKHTAAGPEATIEIAGTIKIPGQGKGQDADIKGTVSFNIATGELKEHIINVGITQGADAIRLQTTTLLSQYPTTQPASQPNTPVELKPTRNQ